MKTGGKLVSNSKLLHFLFPSLLMPMDRANTLSDFYRNAGESINKFIEITKFCFEITNMPENWENYLGNVLVLDYLKDIGMDIIKPDVHVMRVFFRLGFIDSEERTEANIYRVIRVAENIKRETSEKLAVIDAVFWMYGGGGDKHVTKAICSKKEPLCSECPLANHCRYYNIH